jgi:hypothetical protein
LDGTTAVGPRRLCRGRPEDEPAGVPYIPVETRAHIIQGRKARTLVEAGAWALPTAGWRIEYIKENEHALWLVGGKHYARAAGLGSGIETSARHSRP